MISNSSLCSIHIISKIFTQKSIKQFMLFFDYFKSPLAVNPRAKRIMIVYLSFGKFLFVMDKKFRKCSYA